MADKVVLEAEVKSNIGEVSKDAKQLASEFQIMGVSLNSVKGGFVAVGRIAKASFASIRAGLISTGIGAFVVVIGSLIAYFTQTKKGAEMIEKAFAGLGAAIRVITDRIATFGGAIVKLFKGDTKGALQGVKDTFADIGTEIVNDTKAAIDLKAAFIALRDSQRDLNVETAEQRAEIERLKLIAEDVTKSEKDRLQAAEDAFAIENKLLNKRLTNAQESLRIQREDMETRKVDGEFIEEDLDKEAQLRIDLANIIAESTTKQIELNNKINSIRSEAEAKRLEELQSLKDADAERMGVLTKMPAITTETNNELIKADNDYFENLFEKRQKDKKTQEELEQFKKDAAMRGLQLIEGIAGEGSKVAKAAAVAQATAAGVQSVVNAFNSANANVGLTVASGGTYPYIQAGLAAGFSALQIRKIIAGQPPSNDTGGDLVTPTTPAPEMMSGRFELTGGVKPEPVQAYVISDDVTNNQDKLAAIRRRATI